MQAVIEIYEKSIPTDCETIPTILYFLNQFCLTDKGIAISEETQILEKIS